MMITQKRDTSINGLVTVQGGVNIAAAMCHCTWSDLYAQITEQFQPIIMEMNVAN